MCIPWEQIDCSVNHKVQTEKQVQKNKYTSRAVRNKNKRNHVCVLLQVCGSCVMNIIIHS